MRTKVYVAGPISKGDLRHNLDQARKAGDILLKAGYSPFVPHLTAYWAGDVPEALPSNTKVDDWYSMDEPWVAASDAVLRLPGESTGADLEVGIANKKGIPVFHSVSELMASLPAQMRT